jgi:hypothetical protein
MFTHTPIVSLYRDDITLQSSVDDISHTYIQKSVYTADTAKKITSIIALLSICTQSTLGYISAGILAVSTLDTASVYADSTMYNKKAYLKVPAGTVGALLEVSTGNWYMATPASSISPGDTVKYVLDMSGMYDSISPGNMGTVEVSDYIVSGHTSITNLHIPYLWTGGTLPVAGTPTTVATLHVPANWVSPVSPTGGYLTPLYGSGVQSGILTATATGLTYTFNGMPSPTNTDGWISQTFINSAGEVVVMAYGHKTAPGNPPVRGFNFQTAAGTTNGYLANTTT